MIHAAILLAVTSAPLQAPVDDAQREQPVLGRTDDRADRIGRKLRCPVCQGMPIAESPSEMAQDMMGRVREMLAEGQSEQEIIDYFVLRYGEWVRLEPTTEGMNLALWVLPPALLAAAIVTLFLLSRRRRAAPAPAPASPSPAKTDAYLDAVRDEVSE
jgi:cytochrome c-type biogenesis protein CcmH